MNFIITATFFPDEEMNLRQESAAIQARLASYPNVLVSLCDHESNQVEARVRCEIEARIENTLYLVSILLKHGIHNFEITHSL